MSHCPHCGSDHDEEKVVHVHQDDAFEKGFEESMGDGCASMLFFIIGIMLFFGGCSAVLGGC